MEEILYEHGAVEERVLVGLSRDEDGEEVTAFVKLKQGEDAAEDELIRFCKKQIAPYKPPRKVFS